MLSILFMRLVACARPATSATAHFAQAEYWDRRYANDRGAVREWYNVTWDELRQLFVRSCPRGQLDILVTGCGTSPLGMELARETFVRRLVSTDVSPVLIQQMREKHPQLEWAVADVRDLRVFANESFDAIVDKGSLDALRGDGNMMNVEQMFMAYRRVLRPGGVAMIVTSCDIYVCEPQLLRYFESVTAEKLPKKNIKALKAKAAALFGAGFAVREYDIAYFCTREADHYQARGPRYTRGFWRNRAPG